MPITVTSAEFGDGRPIPRRFTCEGENTSPPLDLPNVPPGCAELVLLVEDLDALVGRYGRRSPVRG